jgi:hypothetical protein
MKIMEVNTVYKRRSAVFGLLLGLIVLSSPSQAGPPAAPKPRLAGIIDEVVAKGPASQIPPHLSVVLGITTTQQPTAVKQAVMRAGDSMHTFNVRSDQQSDVVLMAYDSRTRATNAYLTNPAGTLRKAVSYQPGEAPIERKANEAGGQFAAEIKFWLNLSKTAAPAPR